MNESRLSEFWQNSLRHRSFVIGLILSFMMLFTGLLSLFWTPFSVELLDIHTSWKARPQSIGLEQIILDVMLFQC